MAKKKDYYASVVNDEIYNKKPFDSSHEVRHRTTPKFEEDDESEDNYFVQVFKVVFVLLIIVSIIIGIIFISERMEINKIKTMKDYGLEQCILEDRKIWVKDCNKILNKKLR